VIVRITIDRTCTRKVLPAALLAFAVISHVNPAAADEFDTVNLVLSQTITYDNNIFRSSDATPATAGSSGKADRIQSTSLGFKINKPYAQQRFQIDYAQSQTRFDEFNFLNSEAQNYRAAWLFALTPHLTGTLSADQTQSQSSFAQFGGTQRNLRTSNGRTLTIDGWLSGGWHVIGGLVKTVAKSEQTSLSLPSSESQRIEAGVRYDASSTNSIAFTQRSTPTETINLRLDPVNLIETNYRDVQSELRVHWVASGKSSIDGTLARTSRVNDHFAQRDFAATTGELRYGWTPTGKLQVNFTANRAISPYAAFGNTIQNSTYVIDRTYSFGAQYQLDAKLGINLNMIRKQSDYGGPIFVVTGPPRVDSVRSNQLGLNYSPLRSVTLSANISHDRRDSNAATFQFSGTVMSISAQGTF